MAKISLKARVTNAIAAARNGSKAQHELLCDLLTHAEKHGDYTEMVRLINGIADTGYRVKALISWATAHTPINFGEDENGAVTASIPKKADKRRPYLLAEAAEVPYWKFTVENAPKPVDMVKLILALAKKAQKNDAEFVEHTSDEVAAALAELTAAVSA